MMVKIKIKVDRVLGERVDNNGQEPGRAQVLADQTVDVIAYVGELLPSRVSEDLKATLAARSPRSEAAVVSLLTGKQFIFSFDRSVPYPPGSAKFYSAAFSLEDRDAIQQILSTGAGIPSCPKAPSSAAVPRQEIRHEPNTLNAIAVTAS
jgi:hypothetical protein